MKFTQETADDIKEFIDRQVGKDLVLVEIKNGYHDITKESFVQSVPNGDSAINLKWLGEWTVSD